LDEKAISSISPATDQKLKQTISSIFQVTSFVIAPYLPKEGTKGLLLAGSKNGQTVINEGDEELIELLANQIGQALENARLFEKTLDRHTRNLKTVLNSALKSSPRPLKKSNALMSARMTLYPTFPMNCVRP